MNANPKSTKDDPVVLTGKPETPEMFFDTFAGMFHKGLERLVGLQKTTLDVINAQTFEMNQLYRRNFRNVPEFPGMMLVDVTEEALGKLIEAEKQMLDVMVKQSAHVVELTKERADTVSKATGMANELFRETTDRGVAVQKIVLDLAADESKVLTQAVKRQSGVAGTPVATAADNIEKGVRSVVDTQKEILDAAAKPLKAGPKA